MGDFDSNIGKFLLFYQNLNMMLKAHRNVLTPRDYITTLLRALLMVKDDFFRDYIECKKEQYN